MNKVPVGETIARGYGFAAARILTIFGLSWLPAVFYAVAASFWLLKLSAAVLSAPRTEGLNDFELFDIAGLGIVTALASAVIGVALTREALERSHKGVSAYLVVAGREWRLFFALLQVYALLFGTILLAGIVGRVGMPLAISALGEDRQWLGIPAGTFASAGLCTIALAVLATILIRFDFFTAVQAATEDKCSLSRGWALSAGNFWRLLIVALLLLAPLCLAIAGAAVLFAQPELGDALKAIMAPASDATVLWQWVSDNTDVIGAISAVALVAFNAVFAGAVASAYGYARDGVSSGQAHTETAPLMAEPAMAFADYRPQHEPQSGMPVEPMRLEPKLAPASLLPVAEFPLPATEPIEAESPPLDESAQAEMVHEAIETVDRHQVIAAEAPAEISHDELVRSPHDAAVESQLEPPPAGDHLESSPHADASLDAEEVLSEPEGDLTPLPSSADATEPSQQNAPLEAV